MGNFEEISRQLGYTFTALENAQGAAKRRWLRKAHLLLLLADEMIVEAEPAAPSLGDESFVANSPCNESIAGTWALLRSCAEDAVHSAERGQCRGLQTVLVLRKRPTPSTNPEAAVISRSRHP